MTRRRHIRYSPFLGVGLVVASAALANDAAPGRADEQLDGNHINLGYPDADSQLVAEHVALLGHPEFAQREAAADALARLCPQAFRQLARFYREDTDYETRVRIEQIVRDQYLWHMLLKHKGFLGVAYQQSRYTPLPDGGFAVEITSVEPGTAADDAGLRRHDLIRAIDGMAFSKESSDNAFRDLIQAKGAGGVARLDIVRNGKNLTIEVTLRARPLNQYIGPELMDEMNRTLQELAGWWDRHFARPTKTARRTPTTAILEIPK